MNSPTTETEAALLCVHGAGYLSCCSQRLSSTVEQPWPLSPCVHLSISLPLALCGASPQACRHGRSIPTCLDPPGQLGNEPRLAMAQFTARSAPPSLFVHARESHFLFPVTGLSGGEGRKSSLLWQDFSNTEANTPSTAMSTPQLPTPTRLLVLIST